MSAPTLVTVAARRDFGLRWQSAAATPLSLGEGKRSSEFPAPSRAQAKAVSPLRFATAVQNAWLRFHRAVSYFSVLFVAWLPLCATTCLASEAVAGAITLPVSPLPFGLNSLMPVPVDNPLTEEKIALGRRLFFDKQLSRDGTISCATCHHPDKAFTDGRALPVGIAARPGRRNVPSLVNICYAQSHFWDGRVRTLEAQALIPLTSPNEMGNTLEAVVASLSGDPSHRQMFAKAFGSEAVTASRIADALATYQRSLVAGNTPYDRYLLLKDESALGAEATRGLKLFRGKARCAFCHEGPLFTDQKFHNTGVSWSRQPLDLGRYEFTGREGDQGRFKTPSLRNLLLTAPYMHDGSFKSLTEIVEFYNRGAGANPYLDPAIQPLNLSREEKLDLLAFLSNLTSVLTVDLVASRDESSPKSSLSSKPVRHRLRSESGLVGTENVGPLRLRGADEHSGSD